MAWETRKGRGRYYTRSRKVKGRVVRDYIGTGPVAELAARIDEERRLEREDRQAERRVEAEAWQKIDDLLADLDVGCRVLTAAALLRAGYHQHKRQWRRRRDTNRGAGQQPGRNQRTSWQTEGDFEEGE